MFSTFLQTDESKQQFWKEELQKWQNNTQDPRLHEYGDIIPKTKDGIETFIHVPTEHEVMELISVSGFQFIEKVASFNNENTSQNCTYWVGKKSKNPI